MCKRLPAWVLALCLALALVLPGQSVRAEDSRLLVLYSTREDAPKDTLLVLRTMMMYMNQAADFYPVEEAPDFAAYLGVVLCLAAEEELPDALVNRQREEKTPLFVIGSGGLAQLGETVYRKGSLMARADTGDGTVDLLLQQEGVWMLAEAGEALGGQLYVNTTAYPLCQTVGQVTHLAYFDPDQPTLQTLLATLLQNWQWPYENAPLAYGQYLVLNEVYPFEEPEELMRVTDMLREEGVPYAISLMPIYNNASYPAMKRFCEFLRYEQSIGTGIILRAPQVSITLVDAEDLKQAMQIAYEAYTYYEVYPVALEVPEAWLLTEKGLDILSGWRTLLLFETDELLRESEELNGQRENLAYRHGHQLIAPAWKSTEAFTSAYAQAIYLDPREDLETLRTYVQRLKHSRRILKSITGMENAVYIGANLITQGTAGLNVNGRLVDTSFTPFVYESYTYDRGFMQYMTEQIETSNEWILLFVGVASTTFLVMIALMRRQNRRNMLGDPRARRKEGETE